MCVDARWREERYKDGHKNFSEKLFLSGYIIGEPIYPFQICHIDGLSNMVVLVCVNDIASHPLNIWCKSILSCHWNFVFHNSKLLFSSLKTMLTICKVQHHFFTQNTNSPSIGRCNEICLEVHCCSSNFALNCKCQWNELNVSNLLINANHKGGVNCIFCL